MLLPRIGAVTVIIIKSNFPKLRCRSFFTMNAVMLIYATLCHYMSGNLEFREESQVSNWFASFSGQCTVAKGHSG